MFKYAAFEVLSAVQVGGRGVRAQAVGFPALRREAHRHAFEYDPKPGFLYVRSRAISSRCNDNYDEFPAAEIKTAYRTFIGKPVFVNHVNENHRRARGVVIDAALHEDKNPDGSPDTWCEVLMEVDAVKFPKLAEAILKKHIERTSMGTDVEYSVCSFCGNRASTPLEYCAHIPKLKGKRIYRTTAAGQKEGVLVREICFGLKFFENSLLVEEPADPTAYFLGVDDSALTGHLARSARLLRTAVDKDVWKDEDEKKHPRGKPKNKGQFAEKPGGGGEAPKGKAPKDGAPKGTTAPAEGEGDPNTAKPVAPDSPDGFMGGSGTKTDPIKTTNPTEAAAALAEGKWVRLQQPKMVSTLLNELAAQVKAAKAAGESAPNINLCQVTVGNTNLFCVESKGIPRIKMPQLRGKPTPGSKAAEREVKNDGNVDLQEDFRHSLINAGIAVERTTEKASFLKATQNELIGGKVAGMAKAMEEGNMSIEGSPIFVSSDNYIVDGHHRWAALVGRDADDNVLGEIDMDIERVDMDIITLLQKADEFCQDWGIPSVGMDDPSVGAPDPVVPKAAGLRKSASLIQQAVTAGIRWWQGDWNKARWTFNEHPYVAGIHGNKDARGNLVDYTYTASVATGEPGGMDYKMLTHGKDPSITTAKTTCEKAIAQHKLTTRSNMNRTAGATDMVAPADVDTLRDELCPVCGESDTYDGDRCQVCNFVKPPDEFMDPDLDEAKRNDLRQEDDDVAPVEDKSLACDNCGANFKGVPADGEVPPKGDENKATAPVVPEKTPVEVVDEQKPADAKEVLRERNTLPKPKKQDPQDPAEQKDELSGPPQQDAKVDAEEPETAPKAGDTCPDCGKGKLQEAAPKPMDGPDDEEPVDESDEDESEEDSDENPFAKKDKDSKGEKPEDKKKKKPSFPPKKKGSTQKEQSMRPALAALVEQQKVIEDQDKRIAALEGGLAFVARLAGVDQHPKLAALVRTADENNPAQPLADPASEPPTETTEEALAPEAKDDVATPGPTPLTDVAPGATADVTTPVDSSPPTMDSSTPQDTTPPAPDLAPISRRKHADSTVLDEPLDLNEVDVTAPVAGTEEVRPLNEVKIETEQRMGEPTQEVAFPLEGGPFAEKATTGSTESRTIAGLRLARLRMQAGIAEVGDDLALGTQIAASDMSPEAMQTEINTLAAVMAARPRQVSARRNLVPRQAAGNGSAPSFQEPAIPVQEVVAGVDEGEFLFE